MPWERLDAVVEQAAPLLEVADPAPDPAMDAVAARVAGLPVQVEPDMRSVLFAKLLLNLNNAVNVVIYVRKYA